MTPARLSAFLAFALAVACARPAAVPKHHAQVGAELVGGPAAPVAGLVVTIDRVTARAGSREPILAEGEVADDSTQRSASALRLCRLRLAPGRRTAER
jgi:hypothetical protein